MTAEVQSNGSQSTDPVSGAPHEMVKSVATETEPDSATATHKPKEEEEKTKESTTLGSIMEKNSSFREESNFLSDLTEPEKKALFELRSLVETKLLNPKEGDEGEMKEMSLWSVPLLPSKCPESNNVILLKFLRAREFKVKDAYKMLEKTLEWRKESKIDSILEESSLGEDLGTTFYMNGTDREGRPVCYNLLGAFRDEETYQRAFGSEEKKRDFLRWRVQLMEKGIEKLEFGPGKPSSFVQVIDLKDAPGLSKKEIRVAMKEVVELLQDNYPEFVAKNIFINAPFWYYAFGALISPFLTQRTRSKFVFARPSRVTETLLKYIPVENIPVSYGGLKRENDSEIYGDGSGVLEQVLKANSVESIEIPLPQVGTTLVWDLTVLGWEVHYKEEFVPSDEGSYSILIQKERKLTYEEKTVCNSFKNNEPGKVVLTIDNFTYKKKKALYRYKIKHC
ncbi:patellin-4-like protein [Carex littledalei]|uniref:Patellin-4-like protein n=1 Tax=Carex littledalei TaxID=544730 RepID=A0A833VCA9_9POAL|nr:patellin-4-like protein [Carex littledalei]